MMTKRLMLLVPIVTLLAGVMLFNWAGAASAETAQQTADRGCRSGSSPTTVTNGDDSGLGSLRAAVTQAQFCANTPITFAPEMDGETVTLASELVISEQISVSAENLDVTISGNDATRMFFVMGTGDLTLAHVTLTNGSAGAGGAIFNLGKLTIESSQLINNRTIEPTRSMEPRGGLFAAGGAIYNNSGAELIVRDTQFSDNVASAEGGAILNLASAEIHNSTILSNSAAAGGGIYSTGTLTVQSSQLAHNQAGNVGNEILGGGSFGSGGAVYVQGSAEIHNTNIDSNSAVNGGGIFNAENADPTVRLLLSQSTLRNNTSFIDGGGLYNEDTAFISNSTLSGNHAHNLGGAIFGTALFLDTSVGTTVINSTLSDNRADGNADGRGEPSSVGAAINIGFSNLGLGNSIIANSIGGADCIADSFGVSDFGHNLIESSTNACGLTDGTNGNIIGLDPALAPLAANPSTRSGQVTLTHALLANSPAIDAAKNALCPDTDQRGAARPGSFTTACDIGAFEAQDVPGRCAATPDDGATLFITSDATAIEQAIAALAPAADTVKVAGVCAGVSNTAGFVQTVYIDRSLTLAGGYTTTDWTTPTGVNTLLDAQCDGVPGRVLLIDGEIDVTVRNMDITCGDARGLDGPGSGDNDGGGVQVNEATVTLADSRVFSNTAENGGGIHAASTVTITHSQITTNTATLDGGGVYYAPNVVVIISLGIHFDQTTLAANEAGGEGGGLFVRFGTATFDDSEIVGNSAETGGAVHSVIGTLIVRDSSMEANNANLNGGAAFVDSNSTLTLTQSSIISNTAIDNGGALYNEGTATIEQTTIAQNHTDARGGAVVNSGGTLIVHNSRMEANSADLNGGAIRLRRGGTVEIDNSAIVSNTSSVGGGIFADGNSSFTLRQSNVSHNNASGDGGGLLVQRTATIEQSTIAHNNAVDGGGIFHGSAGSNLGDLTLLSSTVFSNTASGDGGGIFSSRGLTTITNSTLSGNVAGDQGGGIRVKNGADANATMVVTFSTVAGNAAGDQGGGFSVGNADLTELEFLSELKLERSIVANSVSGADCHLDGNHFVKLLDFIIEDRGPTCTFFTSSGDPLLGPLADNGGPTLTHALLPGSPAIDAVPNAECPDTDQRGFLRNVDTCDIGAFEVNAEVPTAVTVRQSGAVATSSITVLMLAFCLTAVTTKIRNPKSP